MKYQKKIVTEIMTEFVNDWVGTLNYEQIAHLSILMANADSFEMSPSETATIILSRLCSWTKKLPKEHKECINQKLTERFVEIRKQFIEKREKGSE